METRSGKLISIREGSDSETISACDDGEDYQRLPNLEVEGEDNVALVANEMAVGQVVGDGGHDPGEVAYHS